MPLEPINQSLSERPVESEGLLGVVNREIFPFLRKIRGLLAQLVDAANNALLEIYVNGVLQTFRTKWDFIGPEWSFFYNDATGRLEIQAFGVPLSRVRFIDIDTAVPAARRDGSIGRPYASFTEALAAGLAGAVTLRVVPGNYSAEPTITSLGAITSLTIQSEGGVVTIPDINIGAIDVTLRRCSISLITCGFLRLVEESTLLGVAIVSQLFAVRSTFSTQTGTFVFCSGTSVNFDDCFFANVTPNRNLTFTGAAGLVGFTIDSNTHWKVDVGSGISAGITNGTRFILNDTTL